MRVELDGALVWYGGPTGGRSAWAFAPGLILMAGWTEDEPWWWRQKVLAHERAHFDEEAALMIPGATLAAGALAAWTALPWWAVLTAALVAGWLCFVVPYGASPWFRSRSELSAEAAEKAWLWERGDWTFNEASVEEVVDSHLDSYYGDRWFLRGDPPPRRELRRLFRRYLERRGVRSRP